MKVYKTEQYLFVEFTHSAHIALKPTDTKNIYIWYDKSKKKWFRTWPDGHMIAGGTWYEFPDEALAAVINNLINEGKLPHGTTKESRK